MPKTYYGEELTNGRQRNGVVGHNEEEGTEGKFGNNNNSNDDDDESASFGFDDCVNGVALIKTARAAREAVKLLMTLTHMPAPRLPADLSGDVTLSYRQTEYDSSGFAAEHEDDAVVTRYHACDVEVASIDIKKETPVGHGDLACFSVYCGPDVDFDGNGSDCLWVDTLGPEREAILDCFRPYFENHDIKKVWHNYGFDRHVLERHALPARGFGGDTMHMARLYDTSRELKGYSLEALSRDILKNESDVKTGMKELFGVPNVKKDGTEGKQLVLPDVRDIQQSQDGDVRTRWVRYSVTDTRATWALRENLEARLRSMRVHRDLDSAVQHLMEEDATMWDLYKQWWLPFGELLTGMEQEGMLVNKEHLRRSQVIAEGEVDAAIDEFRAWAKKVSGPGVEHMNVQSAAQIRQLLYGGYSNPSSGEALPRSREFTTENDGSFLGASGKPTKNMPFQLEAVAAELPVNGVTPSGWPSVNGPALRALAGVSGAAASALQALDSPADVDTGDTAHASVVDGEDPLIFSEEEERAFGGAYPAFGRGRAGLEAAAAFDALCTMNATSTLLSNFILPLQEDWMRGPEGRVHCSLNINTETGRLSARRPNLQNQPALEKDKYQIRKAFTCAPGRQLVVADYGQLELRLLAHITRCKSMLDAFEAGGDFHSRTALGMYDHVRDAVDSGECLLERAEGDDPNTPLLKDIFSSERRKAKILNFSIAYGKTVYGLAHDFQVSEQEAQETVDRWYGDRAEVRRWQQVQQHMARREGYVTTLLGRRRNLPDASSSDMRRQKHGMRAAINTPIQGSAADITMLAMLEISRSERLRKLGWRLLMQIHDEVILEGPEESAEEAMQVVKWRMEHPFRGTNPLEVDLAVDAKTARTWYEAK